MKINQDKTSLQFDNVVSACRATFVKKMQDYGPSWRIFRKPSMLDQILIKAKRLRQIQTSGEQKVKNVGDDVKSEFQGVLNYAIMALIQENLEDTTDPNDTPVGLLEEMYDKVVASTKDLMQKKNYDYGEAWRDFGEITFVDLILTKLLRIKQIYKNDGKVQASEPPTENYKDIINYSIFALILMSEKSETIS